MMLKIEKTKPFQKWFDSIKDKILKVAVRQKIERIEKDGYLGKTSQRDIDTAKELLKEIQEKREGKKNEQI